MMKRLEDFTDLEMLMGRSFDVVERHEIVSILKRAKTRIELLKWIQGQFFLKSSNGELEGCCLHGAIEVENNGVISRCNDVSSPVYLARELLRMHGYGASWNDSPYRTRQDVIKAIDFCINYVSKEFDKSLQVSKSAQTAA